MHNSLRAENKNEGSYSAGKHLPLWSFWRQHQISQETFRRPQRQPEEAWGLNQDKKTRKRDDDCNLDVRRSVWEEINGSTANLKKKCGQREEERVQHIVTSGTKRTKKSQHLRGCGHNLDGFNSQLLFHITMLQNVGVMRQCRWSWGFFGSQTLTRG